MTVMKLKEAIEAAKEKYSYDYEYIAVRTQDEPFQLGEIDHCSHVWIDNECTDEELDGICATSIKSKAVYSHCKESLPIGYCNGYYDGEHTAIIGGNIAEYGEDDGEVIIKDAVVLEVLC